MSHLVVYHEALTGMQRSRLLGVSYGPKEVAVAFRAAIPPVVRQAQAKETLLSRHNCGIDLGW